MKKVEAIIRTEKLEDLKDALVKNDLAKGMTVTQVLGYGNQKGFVEYVRAKIEHDAISETQNRDCNG